MPAISLSFAVLAPHLTTDAKDDGGVAIDMALGPPAALTPAWTIARANAHLFVGYGRAFYHTAVRRRGAADTTLTLEVLRRVYADLVTFDAVQFKFTLPWYGSRISLLTAQLGLTGCDVAQLDCWYSTNILAREMQHRIGMYEHAEPEYGQADHPNRKVSCYTALRYGAQAAMPNHIDWSQHGFHDFLKWPDSRLPAPHGLPLVINRTDAAINPRAVTKSDVEATPWSTMLDSLQDGDYLLICAIHKTSGWQKTAQPMWEHAHIVQVCQKPFARIMRHEGDTFLEQANRFRVLSCDQGYPATGPGRVEHTVLMWTIRLTLLIDHHLAIWPMRLHAGATGAPLPVLQ